MELANIKERIASTIASSDLLFKLEDMAIALIKEGKYKQALAIAVGGEYGAAKEALSKGLCVIFNEMTDWTDRNLKKHRMVSEILNWVQVLFATVLLVSAITYSRRAHAALDKQQKLHEELVHHQEHLEELVAERTADLSAENTERKRAEDALRASEARFQTVLDNTPAAIYLRDRDGRYSLINEAYREIFQVTEGEVYGKTVNDLLPATQAQEYKDQDREVIEQGRIVEFETVIVRGDETQVLATIKFPIRDIHGNIEAVGGVDIDISERKEAERVLAEKEAQLRLAMENMPGGMLLVDSDQNFSLFNRQYSELFEFPDDLITEDRPLLDMIHFQAQRGDYGKGRFVTKVGEMMRLFRSEQHHRYERHLQNGRILEVNLAPTPDGGTVAVATDITERKLAEEENTNQRQFIELLHRISVAASEAETVEISLQVCLDEICNFVGWLVGHAYLCHPDREFALTSSLVFHLSDPDAFKVFQELTVRTEFRPGEGLPGRVYQSGKPECSIDVTRDVNFPRAKLARDIGVKSGFAFPVAVEGRMFAVLEFFTKDVFEPDQKTLDIVSNICRQLGGVIARKQAEKRLRVGEERLKLALNGADQGYWDINFETGEKAINEKWAEMLGYDMEEITDFEIVARESFHPDDRNRIDDYNKRYAAGEFEDYQAEYRVITKQGETRWQLSKAGAVARDAAGKPLRLAGTVLDITERKQAEQKLADAYGIISSSIDYATNIQQSILPNEDSFSMLFGDHFVLWEPRDRVGGDFYWNRIWGDGVLIILADCTGHGVPGAFVTLIATGALDRAMEEIPPGEAGKLVARMHQLIQLTLGQHVAGGSSDDGLELGACYLGGDLTDMTFAGARFSLFIDDGTEIAEIKGDKKGIGYRSIAYDQTFTDRLVPVNPELSFYMTSDGLIDQVGGPKRRGYGKKRFKALLADIRTLTFGDKKSRILEALVDYQGDESRRDDVSIIGFRI